MPIKMNKNINNFKLQSAKKQEKEPIQNDAIHCSIKLFDMKILHLMLTRKGYKEEFKQFVRQNKLSTNEAKLLKETIKIRLKEQAKEIDSNHSQNQDELSFQQIVKHQDQKILSQKSQDDSQEDVQENSQEDSQENSQEDDYIAKNEQDQLSNAQQKQIHEDQVTEQLDLNAEGPCKKLFESGILEKPFEEQLSSIHHEDYHQTDNQVMDKQEPHSQFQEFSQHSSHQPQINEKFNFLIESSNKLNQNSESKKTLQQNLKERRRFFVLKQQLKSTLEMKKSHKPKSPTLIFSKSKEPKSKPNKQDLVKFKHKSPPAKISPKPKTSNQLQQQKELNHKIFYRLYQQDTASFRQKLKPQQKSPKQIEDQREVSYFLQLNRQKSNFVSETQKSQFFNKLYMTSTQSSMNKKYDQNEKYKMISSYSNEIENVIHNSEKKTYSKTDLYKRKPDLQSRVYQSNFEKRCNAHCEQFKCNKKKSQQNQRVKEKQTSIRRSIKQRSKDSSLSLSLHSKSKYKKSGQCPCCHKSKIQQQEKVKYLAQRKRERSYTSTTQYSIEKLFPRYNVSFISDVLEESYNQLFPGL